MSAKTMHKKICGGFALALVPMLAAAQSYPDMKVD